MKFVFIFVCQALNQLKNVNTYAHVAVGSDPTFHNVSERLLPENGVSLAKLVTEAKKVKRAAKSEFI